MRMRSPNFVFSVVVFLLAFAGVQTVFMDLDVGIIKHASAQEEKAGTSSEDGVVTGDPEAAALAEKQLGALNGQVRGIMKGLGQAELTHFGIIYGNYSVYSMVKAVRNDVGQAVEACIKNNPEMEEQINTRWSKWTKSVDANMKEAFANINAMSMAQDYAPQTEMKRIFSLVDETRAANSSRFEKIPVTTPEACEFMLSKMDETQDNMNVMLIATIRSYPEIMKTMQE